MTDTVTNTAGLAGEVERLRELVLDLGEAVTTLTRRIASLERSAPEARQAQYEADLAAADLAGSGYGEPW